MLFFLIGIALTLFLTAIVYLRINRKLSIKEEEVQRLEQEKQIILDFMQSYRWRKEPAETFSKDHACCYYQYRSFECLHI